MEIAIPFVAMVGLYSASKNDNKKNNQNIYKTNSMNRNNYKNNSNIKEGFSMPSTGNKPSTPYDLPNYNIPENNYPNFQNKVSNTDINYYKNNGAVTDKYYSAKVDSHVLSGPTQFGDNYDNMGSYSLTGAPIDVNNFKHANMVPYFGAKIRGYTANANTHESIMDSYSGSGSQKICKEERAPLFAPENNMNFVNGMPNYSSFYQSRVMPGTQMANVKPWEEIHVGPGLDQGFTTQGSNGFNSGMEARDKWVDRNVDQLRTINNPKVTYSLDNHQGPSYDWNNTAPPNAQTYGRVEKFMPDKFYLNTPDRWFTTTGLEKAQMTRPIEMNKDQNRALTTTEYFGADSNVGGTNTYAPEYYEPSKRSVLEAEPMTNMVCGKNGIAHENDYGRSGHQTYVNQRNITQQPPIAAIYGAMKAAVAPLLDVLRPSRKENAVGSIRPCGNIQNSVPAGVVYNPADRLPTTIKETTESLLDFNHLNVNPITEGTGYLVNDQQPVFNQRDTTNVSYIGSGGGATNEGAAVYEAAYNQHNNVNKVQTSYTPGGNISTFNNNMNVTMKSREKVSAINWNPAPSNALPPSLEQTGKMSKTPQYYKESINCERIQPEILNAFRQNPYTQSLNSYVFS
jgi:hypothetical protein